MQSKKHKGFSLIELLVVVAIIAILSAVGIPAYNGYITDSRRVAATNALRNIYLAQLDFRAQGGAFYDGSGADNDCTAAAVADESAVMMINLFAGANLINAETYQFCVDAPIGAGTFTAWTTDTVTVCGITENNQIIDATGAVIGECI